MKPSRALSVFGLLFMLLGLLALLLGDPSEYNVPAAHNPVDSVQVAKNASLPPPTPSTCD